MAIGYYRALMSLEPDGSYGVVFPELPGCVSHGNNLNDALRMATEAVGMHVTAMHSRGRRRCPAGRARRRPPARVDGRSRGRPWYRSGDVHVLVPVDTPCSVSVKAA
jgi:antitoxin HicB